MSFERRQSYARAWGAVSYFTDLKKIERAEFADAAATAERTMKLHPEFEEGGVLGDGGEFDQWFDERLKDLTDRETVLGKRIYSPQ